MTPPRGVEDAAPYKTWRKLAVACREGIYASRALGGWRKAPGRDKSLPYNNLHRYRARPILAGLRTPRFPVGSVRENAGGHVGQQGELRKLGAGVGQPQTVGRASST